MIVFLTGFIPLWPLSSVSIMVMRESSQWLGKNIVGSTGKKNSIGYVHWPLDITEIMLMTVLNTMQSISHNFYLPCIKSVWKNCGKKEKMLVTKRRKCW